MKGVNYDPTIGKLVLINKLNDKLNEMWDEFEPIATNATDILVLKVMCDLKRTFLESLKAIAREKGFKV